jgi:low temperature requirement protein LtrA
MVAGIVLLALGMKKTLAYVDHPLELVPAFAMFGGVALYLLAHVAFRWRNIHTLNRQRLVLAAVLVALLPLVTKIDALAALAVLAALLVLLIVYETIRFADRRERIRHQVARDMAAGN